MYNFLKNKHYYIGDILKKIIVILGIISLLLILNSKEELIIIPNESIRIRIIANSNKAEDQTLKNKIKDDLSKEINALLKDTKSINEARNILKGNIPEIDITISSSLKKYSSNQTYKINYGMNYFPEKEFKGVIYKEGMYESLVVTLGEGKGNNWWCVLYPQLCMVESGSNVEYKSLVKEIIDKYINN